MRRASQPEGSSRRDNRLPALAAPARDRAVEDVRFAAGLAPEFREARIARGWTPLLLQIVERHADRDGDAFAADDRLPVAQGGDGIEEAARAFGHGGLHEGLEIGRAHV